MWILPIIIFHLVENFISIPDLFTVAFLSIVKLSGKTSNANNKKSVVSLFSLVLCELYTVGHESEWERNEELNDIITLCYIFGHFKGFNCQSFVNLDIEWVTSSTIRYKQSKLCAKSICKVQSKIGVKIKSLMMKMLAAVLLHSVQW